MRLIPMFFVLAFAIPQTAKAEALDPASPITVRTEIFARPPYSGATYYVYERYGRMICTKLAVCNKYNDCTTKYVPGAFKEQEDAEAGEPSSTSPAIVIPPASLPKHVCLIRFGLVRRR